MGEGDRKDLPDTKPPPAPVSTDATLPAPPAGDRRLPTADPKQYSVADEVARGGLGRILRARDHKLDRPVAIKELLSPAEDATARFAREAFLTARLQHPAIVPVYDAGVWPTGSPFYAMKLVSGRSLEAAIRETLTFAERIALLPHVIDVANALAYAHDQRIIHRDL
jgi:eukaryotic-like serine/threonine-protein kinase